MDAPAPGFDERLDRFLDFVTAPLANKVQRATFARYAVGLLSDAERKSMEPLAARSRPDAPGAEHKAFCYFTRKAAWDDRAVRRNATVWALWGAQAAGPVRATILDDTGMLKQGEHSVGVARQYTGSAGKITNCQVAVTLAIATDHDTIPLDVALYLPSSWTEDPARRAEAEIPDALVFRTKGELALEMLQAAHAEDVPLGEVLLADADYGRNAALRDWATDLRLPYAVGVLSTQKIWDASGACTEAITAADYADVLSARQYRRMTWRTDSRGGTMSARFAFARVLLARGDGASGSATKVEQWLVIEWRDGEERPSRFYLSTLPRRLRKKELVRLLKERWRIERMHQDLKGEVGFDHFEGRSWRGWNHHVTVALCAHALLTAERCVGFPPSAPRTAAVDAHRRAA